MTNWTPSRLSVLMNRLVLLFSLFLLLCFEVGPALGAQPFSPVGGREEGRQWLLVIGVDAYEHWPKLESAVVDARALKEVFLAQYHFDRDHVLELYNEEATRANILHNLDVLAEKLEPADSLVILYCGRGYIDLALGEGFWIPVNGATNDNEAWLANSEVNELLRPSNIKARHVLVISSACFTGDFVRPLRGRMPQVTEQSVKKAYRLVSRQALSAGALASEKGENFGKHSAFAHFLLEALEGNQAEYLLPSAFFLQFKGDVAQNARHVPQLAFLEKAGAHPAGELILFKRRFASQDQAELERLRLKRLEQIRKLEADGREVRRRNDGRLAEVGKRLVAIDDRISKLRNRKAAGGSGDDRGRRDLLDLVGQRDEQQDLLVDLKEQQKRHEKKVAQEIKRLRIGMRSDRRLNFAKDSVLYQESIQADPENKAIAWAKLATKYPEAAQVEEGDLKGLRLLVVYGLKKGRAWRDPEIGMEFMWVAGGCFPLGVVWADGPAPETCVDGFWIGRYEVTLGQWRQVIGSDFSYSYGRGRGYPVERVSWQDAQLFLQRFSDNSGIEYRLPTEAEWEYACRSGGKDESYCGGEDLDILAWHERNSAGTSHPIGLKEPNGLGIYDMSGNVWEWVQDWYQVDYFERSPGHNPVGPDSGSARVCRGGSWTDAAPGLLSTTRGAKEPDRRHVNIGFRVVLPLSQASHRPGQPAAGGVAQPLLPVP